MYHIFSFFLTTTPFTTIFKINHQNADLKLFYYSETRNLEALGTVSINETDPVALRSRIDLVSYTRRLCNEIAE